MNKQDIIKVLQKQYQNAHWRLAIGKVRSLPDDADEAFAGISRYIESCRAFNVSLDSNAFAEIVNDYRANNHVWKVTNNDLVVLQVPRPGMKRSGVN